MESVILTLECLTLIYMACLEGCFLDTCAAHGPFFNRLNHMGECSFHVSLHSHACPSDDAW